MKVSDLFETISLTQEQHRIIPAIFKAIEKTLYSIATRIEQQAFNNNQSSLSFSHVIDDIHTYMASNLPKELKTHLELAIQPKNKQTLKGITLDITPLSDKTEGSAGFDNVNIAYKLYQTLFKQLIDELTDHIQDYDLEYKNIVDVLRDYNPSESKYIDSIVKKITSVIVHELVHIHQHTNQKNRYRQGYETEYRSYMMNKKKFHKLMNDRLSTSIGRLPYLASPQEIPAFAHNLALDLIEIVLGGYSLEQIAKSNPDLLPHTIMNLKDIIQDSRNYQNNDFFNDYKQFKNPEHKQFKVFKRFMKIVYQEISQYIEKATFLYNKHNKSH